MSRSSGRAIPVFRAVAMAWNDALAGTAPMFNPIAWAKTLAVPGNAARPWTRAFAVPRAVYGAGTVSGAGTGA
ncbi:MAG: hypothetical protein LBQ12_01550 [Deltaproteobacteria bacterium]|jgi:hypothetical protein|nr:hypothetical protein [Deltaproteobacteria bacterium]